MCDSRSSTLSIVVMTLLCLVLLPFAFVAMVISASFVYAILSILSPLIIPLAAIVFVLWIIGYLAKME